jgi:hypothetical protein
VAGEDATEISEAMSYILFSLTERCAQKPHRCIWCNQRIVPGEQYLDERSLFEGSIQRFRWHPECNEANVQAFRETREAEFTAGENERPPRLDEFCAAVGNPNYSKFL